MWYAITILTLFVVVQFVRQGRINKMDQAAIDALVAELQADDDKVNALVTAIVTHDTEFQAQIDKLQAQIDAGTPVTNLDGLNAIKAKLSADIDAAKP